MARARFVFVHPVCLYHYPFFFSLAEDDIWMPNGFKEKTCSAIWSHSTKNMMQQTCIGKFSVHLGIIHHANCKASPKKRLSDCGMVFVWQNQVRVKSYNEKLECITNNVHGESIQ